MILARALARTDTDVWAPIVLFFCFGAFSILTVSIIELTTV